MEQTQVEVEILIQTITAQYGTLNPGDSLRTNAAFAAHLVDDCGAAEYVRRPMSALTDLLPVRQLATVAEVVQALTQAAAPAEPALPIALDGEPAASLIPGDVVQTSAQADVSAVPVALVPPVADKEAAPAVSDSDADASTAGDGSDGSNVQTSAQPARTTRKRAAAADKGA